MALRTEVRVGAFVLSGLVVIGFLIFMIGEARRMFSSKATYYADFEDVGGLIPGSMVQMGGVHVGDVEAVEYPDDPDVRTIRVTLAIVRENASRIRTDSTAAVAPKGMLGDKLVEVTPGSPEAEPLPEGSVIPSRRGDGLFDRINEIGEKAGAVLENLERTSNTLASDEFRGDVEGSAAAARQLLESFNEGEGYVPRLLHDSKEAENLSRAVRTLEATTARLDRVLREVERAVARVNQGPGLAHELIYGEDGQKAAAQFGQAAEEVALTLRGIREGDGLAHDLLFGGNREGDSQKVMSDLAAITGDVRVLVSQVREGKGTLGALMVDPSVYEDLKVLLGNVQRNEVLRALVRYSIQQDEQRRGVRVGGSAPGGSAPGGSVPGGSAPEQAVAEPR